MWLNRQTVICNGSAAPVQAGWGDDVKDAAAPNPFYDPDLYQSYSASTRKNLARVDENRIDFDLLDNLISMLSAGPEEGAILVFLPGDSLPKESSSKIFQRCSSAVQAVLVC